MHISSEISFIGDLIINEWIEFNKIKNKSTGSSGWFRINLRRFLNWDDKDSFNLRMFILSFGDFCTFWNISFKQKIMLYSWELAGLFWVWDILRT